MSIKNDSVKNGSKGLKTTSSGKGLRTTPILDLSSFRNKKSKTASISTPISTSTQSTPSISTQYYEFDTTGQPLPLIDHNNHYIDYCDVVEQSLMTLGIPDCLRPKRNRGGGNCGPISLSHSLAHSGTKKDSWRIRRECLDYIKAHEESFVLQCSSFFDPTQEYIVDEGGIKSWAMGKDVPTNVARWVEKMSFDGVYVDIAFMIAAASVYSRSIWIYSLCCDDEYVHRIVPKGGHEGPIVHLRLRDRHFVALLPETGVVAVSGFIF